MIFFEKKKTVLVLSILWFVIGIISGLQISFYSSYHGMKPDFFDIMFSEPPRFFLWIIYIPVILYLLEKFPFSKAKSKTRFVFLHLVACTVLGFVHMIIYTVFLISTGVLKTDNFVGVFFRITIYTSFYHVFSYAAVLLIGTVMEYYNKYLEKESLSIKLEKLYSDTRLASLKMQLHPHFLFNVLNNISMLIRQNKNTEAVTMISQLSGILRHILDNKEINLIPLKEELDLAQKYLSIESIRFADRLTYKIEIDRVVDEVLVPDLILQPIIENSLKHGLAEKAIDCNIFVTVKDSGDYIVLTVEDNGRGRTDPNDFFKTGKGLTITSDRLKHTYGKDAELNIDSKPNLFTRVSMKIPKQF